MSTSIEHQLRDYFGYVDETQAAVDPPTASIVADPEPEIVVLDVERRTRVVPPAWVAAAAAVVAVLAVTVVGIVGRDDGDEVRTTAPPVSPARRFADELVAALNAHDPVELRALTMDELGSEPVLHATTADELEGLVPWYELIDLEVRITSCVDDGELAVTCEVDVDTRFGDADGFELAPARLEILLSRSGRLRTAALQFGGPAGAISVQENLREFVDFVEQRDPDAVDELFITDPFEGNPRPRATPDALALWELHLAAFIAEWSSDGP